MTKTVNRFDPTPKEIRERCEALMWMTYKMDWSDALIDSIFMDDYPTLEEVRRLCYKVGPARAYKLFMEDYLGLEVKYAHRPRKVSTPEERGQHEEAGEGPRRGRPGREAQDAEGFFRDGDFRAGGEETEGGDEDSGAD